MTPTCFVCDKALDRGEQLVLARGRRRFAHCSNTCLRESLSKYRIARTTRRRRAAVVGSLLVLLLGGGGMLWRHRAPQPQSISYAWLEAGWDAPPPRDPGYYGPAWPPTEDDWMFAFERVAWVYPLPGPARRAPTADDRILGPEPARGHPGPVCRKPRVCGVTLGGQLWGEHVYAVQDGVVDRAHGGDEHGGGYVRIAHFGGLVFTQYFPLAAIPRGGSRGRQVAAGDVIGLVCDTGVGDERNSGPRAHLHFTFSIRPTSWLGETFWDPTPLMERWPLHVPPHGTVAGLAAPVIAEALLRKRRAR